MMNVFLLATPPTLSMMACACGVSAAILSKNATSFSHSSFYKKVQRALIGSNQQVGLQFEKDKGQNSQIQYFGFIDFE